MTELNKEELDRHITGNYGEDQFIDDVCIECGMELLTEDTITNRICENCDEERY